MKKFVAALAAVSMLGMAAPAYAAQGKPSSSTCNVIKRAMPSGSLSGINLQDFAMSKSGIDGHEVRIYSESKHKDLLDEAIKQLVNNKHWG